MGSTTKKFTFRPNFLNIILELLRFQVRHSEYPNILLKSIFFVLWNASQLLSLGWLKNNPKTPNFCTTKNHTFLDIQTGETAKQMQA